MAKTTKVAVEKEAKSPAVKPKAKAGFVIKVPVGEPIEELDVRTPSTEKEIEAPKTVYDIVVKELEECIDLSVSSPVEEVKEKPIVTPAYATVAKAESATNVVYKDLSELSAKDASVVSANVKQDIVKQSGGISNPVRVPATNGLYDTAKQYQGKQGYPTQPATNGQHKGPFPSSKELPPPGHNYPKHMVELALIIKNNAEIRRFTSLGILNFLAQRQEIRVRKDSKKYVQFKWDKFTVKVDNLIKDYSYSDPFFVNCLVASFASFAASAQGTINEFTLVECNGRIWDVADEIEINKISEGTLRR